MAMLEYETIEYIVGEIREITEGFSELSPTSTVRHTLGDLCAELELRQKEITDDDRQVLNNAVEKFELVMGF
jgi:hypothetical protein